LSSAWLYEEAKSSWTRGFVVGADLNPTSPFKEGPLKPLTSIFPAEHSGRVAGVPSNTVCFRRLLDLVLTSCHRFV
jgi:hypothetical protein